jgi:hypothetical protein
MKTTHSRFFSRAAGLAILVAVLGAAVWFAATPAPRVKPKPAEAVVIDKSQRAQAERRAIIDELVAKGLVRRIDPERRGSIRVTLRPAFYTMDDDTRRKYVDVIYAYAFDGTSVNDTVILRDAQHGNEIGQYNPYKGGLKMYK